MASAFIGRQQELTRLRAALGQARAGQGRVVALAGSPGMGKTRLAQQLAFEADASGVAVLWGRCLEEAGAPLYWPWRQVLRGYAHEAADADLAAMLGPGLPHIARIVPEIAQRYPDAVPVRASQPPLVTATAARGETAEARFELFDALRRFWQQAAQRRPLLLIFDDLHWADPSSLRLLAHLASEWDHSALLLLATYRDSELCRGHPLSDTLAELMRSPSLQRLQLAGFDERETAQFMAASGGGIPAAALVDAIHLRTEGHPLFVQETVRFLRESRPPGVAWAGADDAGWSRVPAGVREVIGKRLARLSLSAGSLLSMAACIGRQFDLELLAWLDADKTEDEVLAALEEAIAARLIEPVPQAPQFRFSHALIRETLYEELLSLRRVKLHRRIAEWLERRHAADPTPHLPQLAYHYGEAAPGGAAAAALGYARRAAEEAARCLAHEEAVRFYRLALRLQREHRLGDAAGRCDLLLALGQVQYALGAGEAGCDAFLEAADLARALVVGDAFPSVFAQAALGYERVGVIASRPGAAAVQLLQEALAAYGEEDLVRIELLASLCRACVHCDRPDEALTAHHQAVALARRLGHPRGLFAALVSIASAGFWPELLSERLQAAGEAWAIAEQSLGLRWTLAELVAYYLCDLIRVGDTATCEAVVETDRRVSRQVRSHYHEAISFCTGAVVAINEGRFDEAERLAVQGLEIGRRVTEDLAISVYGTQMFCLRREQGRLHEVRPVLQHFARTTAKGPSQRPNLALLYAELDMHAECRAEFDALPWHLVAGMPKDAGSFTFTLYTAEACVYLEDAPRAATLYDLLRPHAGTNLLGDSSGPCLGSADRLLGNLAALQERWDLAQQHFDAALEMDTRTGWRVWLAHGRHDFARMLHRRGRAADRARAHGLLEAAHADALALGMKSLAARIQALRERLAVPEPAYPCGLTPREVEVLRLIAIGRNNRDIAQVLAISSNTVANHVRSILEKTYCANRTEAAAFARHTGLLAD